MGERFLVLDSGLFQFGKQVCLLSRLRSRRFNEEGSYLPLLCLKFNTEWESYGLESIYIKVLSLGGRLVFAVPIVDVRLQRLWYTSTLSFSQLYFLIVTDVQCLHNIRLNRGGGEWVLFYTTSGLGVMGSYTGINVYSRNVPITLILLQ